MTAAKIELILIRYGELALKGGNRTFFEKQLVDNIERATRSLAKVKVYRERGRMTAVLKSNPERVEAVARRMQEVPGIASLSMCIGAEANPDVL